MRPKKIAASFLLYWGSLFFMQAQTKSLDFYLQEGVKNSPLLKDYQNQVQSNTLDSLRIRASRRPQVDASGTIMLAPTINGYGYDQAISNGGNYTMLAGVTQPVFAKKIFAPQYETVRIENQRLSNVSRISEHDLKKSIVDQYLAIYSDQNQLTFLQSTYDLLKNQEVIFKKLVERGIYKQTDYLSFEVALQSQEVSLAQSQLKYKSDLNALNLTCGIADTTRYSIEPPNLQEQVSAGENNSAFLQKFKIDSLQILNSRKLTDIKYRPKVNWFADAGLMASNPNAFNRSLGTSFGLNFSMPLYDGKQRNIQYQKLSIAQNTVTQYNRFFKNQYRQHIEQAHEQIAGINKLVLRIKNQLSYSDMLITANRQLLERGELSVIDYIIAIKNQIEIKNQLNNAELQKLQLINELNYWNW